MSADSPTNAKPSGEKLQQPAAGTLGDVLAPRRRRRFVGRGSEQALFAGALGSEPSLFSLLHLHGPGGIGKTALLDVFAGLAEQTAARLIRLDGRDLPASQPALLSALDGYLDRPMPASGQVRQPRLVLLFDTYERLAPLDDWIRAELLPRLPASTIIILTGRDPPSPAWLADPAWRELLRVLPLRNLGPDESREYLRLSGVPGALHDRIVEVSHGHPLGLSLLADVVSRGGEAVGDSFTPDLVSVLLRQFLEIVPSALHRRALEVCALARVTTEALLRDALEIEDAHALFAWLRGLSFVESGPDGLYPHDLARDALDADLRWRDLAAYQRIFRGVRAHIWGRATAAHGRAQLRAIFDLLFMNRHQPVMRDQFDWETLGQEDPQPASASDREEILELVRKWQGDEAVSIARRWLDRQPEAFTVLREADGSLRGVLAQLDLTRASAHDLAADPAASVAWEYAHQDAPPRPGEAVVHWRYVIDREANHGRSPTWNAVSSLAIQYPLITPQPGWELVTLDEPERLEDFFAFAAHPRAVGADVEIGGRRYGLFSIDWRRFPVDAWEDFVTERVLADEHGLDIPFALPVATHVLSEQEFGDAVRQALHDLHRPDLLARNPLRHARLLSGHAAGGEPGAAAVADLVRVAADSLREHPRDDKLSRAVDSTYLHAASTQERAAAALGIPFSTYRRHLTGGVARIADWLWERELHGTPASGTEQH